MLFKHCLGDAVSHECVKIKVVQLQMLQKLLRRLTSIGDHAGSCQSKGYGINICPVEEHVVLRFLSRGQIVAVIVDEAEAVDPGKWGGPDKAVPRRASCLPARQLQSEQTSLMMECSPFTDHESQ